MMHSEEPVDLLPKSLSPQDEETMRLFGVRYTQPGESLVYRAPEDNLYDYTAYIGEHSFLLERGDSTFVLTRDKQTVTLLRGAGTVGNGKPARQVDSQHFAVVVRGYMPAERMMKLGTKTSLPYVNGCSTKQLFPPERLGDPTLQYLDIPPFSAEQAHHIHSTVRVVYILSGLGRSIVGMEGRQVVTELTPGMSCILEPMCPHHFDTPQGKHLVCMPAHVWSAHGAAEFNHPMFNGTYMTNQGGK